MSNKHENKIRNSSNLGFKGYVSITKGIVLSVDDPSDAGRVKVRIPGYHGNESDEEKLPWAQVCITKLPSSKSNGSSFINLLQNMFGNDSGQVDMEQLSLLPSVGDVVWLTFEGGDINKPVVMGVLEYTARKSLEQSGTGDVTSGSNFSISEGSPAYMMAQIMFKYESNGDYGSFVSPAEDRKNGGSARAITIGAHQCMGPHAKSLLQYLRSLNQSEFDKIASPSGLLADVTGGDSWNTYNVSKGSAKGQAIIKILKSEWGKKGQITKAAMDVQGYMQEAKQDYGVTDIAATLYICDIIHQYGRGGTRKYYKGKSISSLEDAFRIAPKQYITRRRGVFNDLKALRDAGKLNGGDVNPSTAKALSLSESDKPVVFSVRNYKLLESEDPIVDITNFKTKFIFPLMTIRNITKYYEDTLNPLTGRHKIHDGIDLYSPNISGQKVYASFDGIIEYKTDLDPISGCGNQISLIANMNSNIIAEYRHLNIRLAKEGSSVKAGDIIGTVGNTGNASFPMLHYSLKINGGYQNPLLFLKN